MADYDFYTGCYLGSVVPEKAFPQLAAQAQQYLERLKCIYKVESSGAEAEKMAVCAIAETLWNRRKRTVNSASVGNVSVRYTQPSISLQRELYEKAAIYLDIYRGVC